MQRMKKLNYFMLSLQLLLVLPLSINAVDDHIEISGSIFKDDVFDNPSVNKILESPESQDKGPTITPAQKAQCIIELLLALNAIPLLEEDLYCRTNPLNKRNILDYPEFYPMKLDYAFKWTFGGHLFYNQTSRTFFTSKCDAFSSYLAIRNETLLEKITEVLGKLPLLTKDPVLLFPLFENGTCQERRAGIMFHAERQSRFVNLQLRLPFYYLERNFFFTDEELQAIEQELGAASPEQQHAFRKKHVISDKIGLGDARIDLLFNAHEEDDWAIYPGLRCTLPTAVAWAKGLYGNSFDKCRNRPTFSFFDLFPTDLPDCSPELLANSITIVRDFLKDALDTLAANLLDTNLGNEGHFGLGILLRSRNVMDTMINREWASHMTWLNYLSLEYLCPADEKRFFIQRANPAEFNLERFTDESQSLTNLAFLEQELVNRLFPYPFSTKVKPGVIFEWTSKFQYELECWGVNFGTDLWLKGKEKLSDFCCQDKLASQVDLDAAVLPLAFQAKILAGAFYKAERPTRDWTLGVQGDYSFASRGIGRDFTITFNLEANF